MKAKEFLSKIMHGDKTTIKKNIGLIGFDEKGNHIKEESSAEGLYAVAVQNDPPYMFYLLVSKEEIDTQGITVSANGINLQQLSCDQAILSNEIIEQARSIGLNVTSSAVGMYGVAGSGGISTPSQLLQGDLPLILTAGGKTWQSTYTNQPTGFIMQDPNNQNKGVILWNKSDNVGWTNPQTGEFRISTEPTDKVTFDSEVFTLVSSDSPKWLRQLEGYGYYPLNFAISEEGNYHIVYYYGSWIGRGDIRIGTDISN